MYEWQAEVRYGDEGSIVAVWHYHHYSLTGCDIKLLQCRHGSQQGADSMPQTLGKRVAYVQ